MTNTNFNQQSEHMTGLERLRTFEQQPERRGMAENLGYQLESVEADQVIMSYRPKERHMNLLGSLHGGILASLLDTAMGCAVMTRLDAGEGHTMTDLNTKFLRAVMDPDEVLTIKAWVDHNGRRLLSAAGTIVDSQSRLVARAMATAVRL
ncbi:PaaI family thioesterase [Pseudomaricurvus alkylphenolicus]|jgi:uncharacterized protein (TIGR00369 family)|uniref:PaaI family thioesterase n=1 Tax=Pseudomaricurvus alkylphenolicus TaxID=1306991 RepID=UPI00141FB925|nr:PaaI family thioesterase [Pseudomaricurvus alkylphenolicus]NIB43338.1 PaaI family thioesterase [Pseudomaricurvus alkylphenolicus]